MTSALINALRVRYPVVEKLVGTPVFDTITQDFVASHRPASPVLIDYGGDYPDFNAANSELPHLADIARLESLWWQAYHAADIEPLAAGDFAVLSPENLETAHFAFHPSAAIIASRWAIGAIWKAARQNAELNAIEIGRPQTVLVWRHQMDVQMNVINPATAQFLITLMEGKGLAEAIGADPHFDLQTQFQILIASQLVTEIHL